MVHLVLDSCTEVAQLTVTLSDLPAGNCCAHLIPTGLREAEFHPVVAQGSVIVSYRSDRKQVEWREWTEVRLTMVGVVLSDDVAQLGFLRHVTAVLSSLPSPQQLYTEGARRVKAKD